jgi:hypothetical protein
VPGLNEAPERLGFLSKVRMTLHIWRCYLGVRLGLTRYRLPALVARLSGARGSTSRIPPKRLGQMVGRALRIGPIRPRCLTGSLVLYRLLSEQGDQGELVIGLPRSARDKEAHAWIEIEGRDVGPPPGRGQHSALARYGAATGVEAPARTPSQPD